MGMGSFTKQEEDLCKKSKLAHKFSQLGLGEREELPIAIPQDKTSTDEPSFNFIYFLFF